MRMYSLYSLYVFPQCLSVASEESLRTIKWCMQLITSHDKKDCDSKTNFKGSAKPGGVRLMPDGFAVVPLQLATEGSYCKPKG